MDPKEMEKILNRSDPKENRSDPKEMKMEKILNRSDPKEKSDPKENLTPKGNGQAGNIRRSSSTT